MNETVVSLTELISQGTEKRFIFGMDVQPEFLDKMISNSCLHHFDSKNCHLFNQDGSFVTHIGEVFLADISPFAHKELKTDGFIKEDFCFDSGNKIKKKTKFNKSNESHSLFTEIIEGQFSFFCDYYKKS